MRLSPHFDTEEFRCRDGTPVPPRSRVPLRRLCRRYLEPLREQFGPVTVISGHRTPAWNARVGGAPLSQHVYGRHGWGVAADVRARDGRPADWYALLDRLGAGGIGLYDGHVHVDNRLLRARW